MNSQNSYIRVVEMSNQLKNNKSKYVFFFIKSRGFGQKNNASFLSIKTFQSLDFSIHHFPSHAWQKLKISKLKETKLLASDTFAKLLDIILTRSSSMLLITFCKIHMFSFRSQPLNFNVNLDSQIAVSATTTKETSADV